MNEIDRLNMNVNQAMADLTSVKDAIVNNGVEVADGTPSSNYGDKVDAVYEAGKQNATETVSNVIIDKIGSTPTGKNLITYPYIETTKADGYFAITDNGDGTLTVSGDYETTTISEFLLADLSHIKAKAGDTFTISQGDANFEAFIQFECICVDGMSYNVEPMSGSETFTLPDDFVSFGICKLYVYNAPVTVDNFTFYPMLVKGSTVVDWEPYTDSIQLDIMPEKIDEVYETGKQAAYNLVWEGYQVSGTRKDYSNAFKSGFFNDETFSPLYDMKPTKASYMFAYQGYETKAHITDLAARLEEASVVLDTSKCTDFSYMFYVANKITHIPAISLESASGTIDALFTHANALETIDCLIFKEDGSNVLRPDSWGAPFQNCFALKNITIRGKIGCTISFAHSPLLKASIKSIMDALLSTASSKTLTLKLTAVQKAFETSSDVRDGNTSEEWLALVASKSNWTITLA